MVVVGMGARVLMGGRIASERRRESRGRGGGLNAVKLRMPVV